MSRIRFLLQALALSAGSLLFSAAAHAQTDLAVYQDALGDGWQNWGWGSVVDFANTSVVHDGSDAIAITEQAWSAISFHHDAINTTGYGKVTFWINGGANGVQRLFVAATINGSGQPSVAIGPIPANTWQQIQIPLSALGADNNAGFTGFWIQEGTGVDQTAPFYVDQVVITGSVPTIPPPPLNGGMAIYDDALTNGWQNWSWSTTVGVETTIVNSGASSMAVTLNGGGLSLHHADMDTQNYPSLTFWINGGPTGGQHLAINIERDNGVQPAFTLDPLVANTWQKITVPLSALGGANITDLNRITFREASGGSAPTFYLDDMRLDLAPPPDVVHVNIDSTQSLQKVSARMFGLNTAVWDGTFDTSTTAGLLLEADNQALRFPGGSASDNYHWKTNTDENNPYPWATNFDQFAHIAVLTQAQVYITANYGTGTPEEAAAWVTYSNKTKGYNFKYWEIGNENYGTWEADKNTRPHDPVTYATRFKQYYQQMKAADHNIKVGAVLEANEDSSANYSDESVVNPRTGATHHGWTPIMLATLKQLGVTPDFVSYHRYDQGPGGESDAFLLSSSRTWPNDAAAIRQILNDYLGASASSVEIDCTENNSVYGNPGKQTTSLVNGLFMADSIGNILKTEFKAFFWWDLRNGQETGNNNSPSLYGWRRYGDYGIVTYANPAGPADRYPTFYVYKLLQNFARGGETVVAASSDYNGLGVYAVRNSQNAVQLLLINKHPTATLNVSISVNGVTLGGQACAVYSYGIPQDEAARTGTGSADIAQTTMTPSGNTFTFAPAPYSATVIRLKGSQGK